MTRASEELATDAGLRYVTDDEPGIKRVRRGNGFSYIDARGSVVNGTERERISSLAIPPAWSDVWISTDERGHILATGHDDAGRKQYIYHPRWEEVRDSVKFDRMHPFGQRLPRLRRRIQTDLRRPGLERPRVVALAVAVLDQTLIRVGTARYAKENDSYGLTTLTSDHVEVNGHHVQLAFAGKGGADQQLAFSDRRLAALIARCQELDGQGLFSYETDDGIDAISSTDVNEYVAAAAGEEFTAKDFRTWGASAIVTGELAADPTANERTNERFLSAVDVAAEWLGNSREVCRSSYVHPVVEESLSSGELTTAWKSSRRGKWLTRSESTLNRLLSSHG